MKKLLAFLLIIYAFSPQPEAGEYVLDFSLKDMQFTFLTSPVRLEDLSGAKIAELAKKKGFLPVLYPRRECLFHWLDSGDRELLTFDQLIADPSLFKKPELLIKKNLFVSDEIQENFKKVSDEVSIEGSNDKSISHTDLPRTRQETPAPVIGSANTPRANEREFQAFLDDDEETFLFQREAQSLSRLTGRVDQKGVALPVPPQFPLTQVRSQRFEKEAQIFSDPELLEEYERRISSSTLGRMSSDKHKKRWKGSLVTDKGTPANLKLKASKRTSDGKVLPAQASDFYLTTRDLRELLKDMDAEHALAGEVKSVAEIWANAEKNLSTNPEIALGVKSILLQAKVGRARTNPFGEASLNDLPPDEKYFLIGIDKDENTNVVTIWSKEVEVNPGDNVVELSSRDVIYQD